jgi:hypothetical protein
LRGVGAPGEIVGMKAHGMEILFELAASGASAEAIIAKATKTGDRFRMQVSEEELYTALEQFRGVGAKILSVAQVKASLEEYFMDLIEADRAQGAAVEVSGK